MSLPSDIGFFMAPGVLPEARRPNEAIGKNLFFSVPAMCEIRILIAMQRRGFTSS